MTRKVLTEEEKKAKKKERARARREAKKAQTEKLSKGGFEKEGLSKYIKVMEVNPKYRICQDKWQIWIEAFRRVNEKSKKREWKRVTGYYRTYYDAFLDLADKRWKTQEGKDLENILQNMIKIAHETQKMLQEVIND